VIVTHKSVAGHRGCLALTLGPRRGPISIAPGGAQASATRGNSRRKDPTLKGQTQTVTDIDVVQPFQGWNWNCLATVGFAPHGYTQPTAIHICPLRGRKASQDWTGDPLCPAQNLWDMLSFSKGGLEGVSVLDSVFGDHHSKNPDNPLKASRPLSFRHLPPLIRGILK
jgi:hypothetical protein